MNLLFHFSSDKLPPDDDDEEIPSDSEEEMESETKPGMKPGKRKVKMDEYPGLMKKRHDDFHSYRYFYLYCSTTYIYNILQNWGCRQNIFRK